MAETRKQHLAAGFRTIHYAAIHYTNHHAIHKAYHYHAPDVFFLLTV